MVRRSIKHEHYDIYHLLRVKGMSVSEVSKSLGITKPKVYIVQHRVTKMLKCEIQRLEKRHL